LGAKSSTLDHFVIGSVVDVTGPLKPPHVLSGSLYVTFCFGLIPGSWLAELSEKGLTFIRFALILVTLNQIGFEWIQFVLTPFVKWLETGLGGDGVDLVFFEVAETDEFRDILFGGEAGMAFVFAPPPYQLKQSHHTHQKRHIHYRHTKRYLILLLHLNMPITFHN